MGKEESFSEGYIHFKARRLNKNGAEALRAPPRRQRVLTEVSRAVYHVNEKKFTSWGDFCAWSLATARADHAFVADVEGEVLAKEGQLSRGDTLELSRWFVEHFPPGPFGGLGAGELRSITVEVDDRWITGVCLSPSPRGTGRGYLIGLVSERPLFYEAREAVVTQARYTEQLIPQL